MQQNWNGIFGPNINDCLKCRILNVSHLRFSNLNVKSKGQTVASGIFYVVIGMRKQLQQQLDYAYDKSAKVKNLPKGEFFDICKKSWNHVGKLGLNQLKKKLQLCTEYPFPRKIKHNKGNAMTKRQTQHKLHTLRKKYRLLHFQSHLSYTTQKDHMGSYLLKQCTSKDTP